MTATTKNGTSRMRQMVTLLAVVIEACAVWRGATVRVNGDGVMSFGLRVSSFELGRQCDLKPETRNNSNAGDSHNRIRYNNPRIPAPRTTGTTFHFERHR